MIQRHQRGLIMLNMSLLGVLGLAALAPLAGAGAGTGAGTQPDPSQRGRGNYTMIGGKYTGGSSNAIFIMDAQNQELIAMYWSQSQRTLLPLGYRDLAADTRRLAPSGRKK
jgi:hypothetical protein